MTTANMHPPTNPEAQALLDLLKTQRNQPALKLARPLIARIKEYWKEKFDRDHEVRDPFIKDEQSLLLGGPFSGSLRVCHGTALKMYEHELPPITFDPGCIIRESMKIREHIYHRVKIIYKGKEISTMIHEVEMRRWEGDNTELALSLLVREASRGHASVCGLSASDAIYGFHIPEDIMRKIAEVRDFIMLNDISSVMGLRLDR